MKTTGHILLILFCILAGSTEATGQLKKSLDHSDYDSWKSLSNSKISNDGMWVSYEINPQEGDGYLYLYDIKNVQSDSIARGFNATISNQSEFFVYQVKPTFAETRKAKKDKKKPDEMPKNHLGIHVLPTGQLDFVERVKSYKVPEKGGSWMAYLMEKPEPEKKDTLDGKKEEESSGQPARSERARSGGSRNNNGPKAEGTELIIYHPVKETRYSFEDVTDYQVADNGSVFGIVQVTADTSKMEEYTVSLFQTSTGESTEIFKDKGTLKNFSIDQEGHHFAFIFSSDTAKVKVYDLYLSNGGTAEMIVTTGSSGMTEGWSVSENGSLEFSESGNRLFFGTAEKPEEEPEDTLLDEEKYKLDIWNWQDPYLQPQQKIQAQRERRTTFQAVFQIHSQKVIQLADTEMQSVNVLMKQDGDLAVGSSDLKYRMQTSWDANRYADYYIIDVNAGTRSLVLEAAPFRPEFSPSGKMVVYWCIESKSWKAKPTDKGEAIDLTAKLNVNFFNELHDTPSDPRPYGISGWVEGERYILIQDRYDIWKVDVTGGEAPVLLTNGYGRNNRIQFNYTTLESGSGFRGRFGGGSDEKLYIGEKEEIYLTAFDEQNKQSGLYTLRVDKPSNPEKIVMEDVAFRSFEKAREKDILMFQKGDFVNYPELYVSDMELKKSVRISNTNPQQNQYNWGTVELVKWMSFDGQELQGLLYKPEDFDATKKYPMIVYFYERSSDGLHNYNQPAPSASTINRTYAVSNGYLIFVPDIPYVIGYPGQSAYNAVVSGTMAMIQQFDFIDPDRLGLDGQSWGGYQIAYLITQTDLYACAFSGAPVSNMTSAYGGIRWGSGMSRMFQYEQTQSRIGGTLWEKPIHYIENSPIFFVPKINTPVLIMHNDDDGAVPWYQGIEFFVALRRLQKPAWMLSYNDEAHNLRKRPNRKDLSIRKMQFFDHYLKGSLAPEWMVQGIPAVEKGTNDGYKLVEEK